MRNDPVSSAGKNSPARAVAARSLRRTSLVHMQVHVSQPARAFVPQTPRTQRKVDAAFMTKSNSCILRLLPAESRPSPG
jgi:hypothetical protein